MSASRPLLALALGLGLSLAAGDRALAAAPPGQSAYLNGLHDREAEGWMTSATSGCDKGWITDLQYIGFSGPVNGPDCHAGAVAAGISIIQRLDAAGDQPIPHDPGQIAGYADAFASFVSQCPDIHVWIVGNEPNVGWDQAMNVEVTTTANAEAYAAVHARVHALPGHQSDLVLLASDSPYSPHCICSLRKSIQKVQAKGLHPDGFAIHAYTQAQDPGEFGQMVGLVTSDAMSGSNDLCGNPFHWQFRIYRDYVAAIEAEGEAGKPVFITESGNACRPQQGNDCYPDQDLGYFVAMWNEIDAFNATSATKIRAITPYRWTRNDDGSGRDFEIGARPQLLADLKRAFELKRGWTTPACGTPPGPDAGLEPGLDASEPAGPDAAAPPAGEDASAPPAGLDAGLAPGVDAAQELEDAASPVASDATVAPPPADAGFQQRTDSGAGVEIVSGGCGCSSASTGPCGVAGLLVLLLGTSGRKGRASAQLVPGTGCVARRRRRRWG